MDKQELAIHLEEGDGVVTVGDLAAARMEHRPSQVHGSAPVSKVDNHSVFTTSINDRSHRPVGRDVERNGHCEVELRAGEIGEPCPCPAREIEADEGARGGDGDEHWLADGINRLDGEDGLFKRGMELDVLVVEHEIRSARQHLWATDQTIPEAFICDVLEARSTDVAQV